MLQKNPNPKRKKTAQGAEIATSDISWRIQYDAFHQELLTITPEMATYALAHAAPNRTINDARVSELTDSMRSGWCVDGSPIRFDNRGLMFDGRHRLTACARASVPFRTCVVYGVPPDKTRHVDTNRVRTAGDMLAIRGVRYSLHAAAAACWLLGVKRGSVSGKRSTVDAADLVMRHRGIEDSSGVCYRAMGASPSLIAAVHYIGSTLLGRTEEASAFASVFVDGTPANGNNCSVKAAREYLLRLRQSRTAITKNSQLYIVSDAWNKHASGVGTKHFRVPEKTIIDGLDLDSI